MRTRFRRTPDATVPSYTYRFKRFYEGSWSYGNVPAYDVPNGTNAYIADSYPHRRSDAFPGLEHFEVDGYKLSQLSTSHYGHYSDREPKSSNDLFWVEDDSNLKLPSCLEDLMRYRYRAETPWHSSFYSAAEPHSWSATLSARLARWGLGRGGLAESLGEAPELPKLWHFVHKGRGLVRNASSAYLAYAFGWRPIMDLIPDVMAEIQNYRRRIAPRALRKSGKRVLCFRLPIRPPWVEPEEQTLTHQWPKWPQMKVARQSQFRFTKCEAIGMYQCTVTRRPFTGYEIIDRLADLDGIPNFRTVWELMPMSFVVDYFAGIGDLISRMQGNLLYDIDVTQAALGVRIEGSGSFTKTYGGYPTVKSEGRFRYYWRGPMPTPFIGLSLPGQHAVPTGIALALQRLPRLPRRWTSAAKRAYYTALRSTVGRYATSLAGWPPIM